MHEPADREAILREIAKKKVVYQLPGMDALRVHRDLTYRSTSGALLLMDVYYPSVSPGQRLPTMLLPMVYPDPTARVRAYGPLTSWARLMAASGMAAVVYGAEAPAEDVHAVLRRLRADADALGLDVDRFGLFATSGNVTVGLSALMRDRLLRCAALLYGYTMDLNGSTVVADMGRQAGFVNACAGRSADDLPDGVPMLFGTRGARPFPRPQRGTRQGCGPSPCAKPAIFAHQPRHRGPRLRSRREHSHLARHRSAGIGVSAASPQRVVLRQRSLEKKIRQHTGDDTAEDKSHDERDD